MHSIGPGPLNTDAINNNDNNNNSNNRAGEYLTFYLYIPSVLNAHSLLR